MKNISIYVGTYGKYNSGSLAGAWLNVLNYESKADLSDTEAEAYEAFCSLCSFGDDLSVDHFRDCYMGEWDSEEDFAENLAEECGYLDQMPDNLRHYFDFAAFARDLFFDFDFVDGHVFDLNR